MKDHQVVALVLLGCTTTSITIDQQTNPAMFRALLSKEKKTLKTFYHSVTNRNTRKGPVVKADVAKLRDRDELTKLLLKPWRTSNRENESPMTHRAFGVGGVDGKLVEAEFVLLKALQSSRFNTMAPNLGGVNVPANAL